GGAGREDLDLAGQRPPKPDERPIELEQRLRVAGLAGAVPGRGVDRLKPGGARREPGRRIAVPLHRLAGAVAAVAVLGRIPAGAVEEPDLVALIDERDTRERQEEHRRDPLRG